MPEVLLPANRKRRQGVDYRHDHSEPVVHRAERLHGALGIGHRSPARAHCAEDRAWIATSPVALAPAPTPPRNWWRSSPPPISPIGLTSCATTTARYSPRRVRRHKPPTTSDHSQKLEPRNSGALFWTLVKAGSERWYCLTIKQHRHCYR